MAKRIYKYFGAMIEAQEKWLNSMSAKGYRLTKCTKTYYEFEECKPNEYYYQIDLVIDKKLKELDAMKTQMKNSGFSVFSKNISLNTVVGMIFFRSPMSFTSKFTNSPDILNKELLIIEIMNCGDKIDMTSSDKTKKEYYKMQRNAYVSYLALWIILAVYLLFKHEIAKSILFVVLALFFILPIYIYVDHIKIISTKNKAANTTNNHE